MPPAPRIDTISYGPSLTPGPSMIGAYLTPTNRFGSFGTFGRSDLETFASFGREFQVPPDAGVVARRPEADMPASANESQGGGAVTVADRDGKASDPTPACQESS